MEQERIPPSEPTIEVIQDAHIENLSREVEALRPLAELAFKDHLTSLPNGRRFQKVTGEILTARVKSETAPEHRKTKEPSVVVVMFDINKFKYINDTYGHAAGDLVIQEAAAFLRRTFRAQDEVFRPNQGGDEFLALLKDADIQGLSSKHLSFEVVLGGEVVTVTMSGGATQWHEDEKIEQATGRADAAMYASKQSGEGAIVDTDTLEHVAH